MPGSLESIDYVDAASCAADYKSLADMMWAAGGMEGRGF